jgi:4-amino-4-deoxy-L-arabinose transferase-like glycosyltransferase
MRMLSYRHVMAMTSLFCCSLLLFTWGLSSQEIIGFDSRFYLFALEMWRHGLTLFPTIYQQPYPDYPITSTVVIYWLAVCWGCMNKVLAVLPSASMAALTVVLTYLIGALHSKSWGYYAVCFLLLTIKFVDSARSLALDFYPAMVTAWCFYLVHAAEVKNEVKRSRWIYLLLFFGFVFRGPIGLVIPAGVVCVYYLLARQYKKLFVFSFGACLLLMVSSGLLLGLAYHEGGSDFVNKVLHMQIIGRFTKSSNLPIYFYLTAGLVDYALSFPFALFTLLGIAYYVGMRRQSLPGIKFLQKLIGWVVVILIGMSIPASRKIRYILPVVPALALLAAYPFVTGCYFVRLRTIGVGCFFLLPFLMLALLGVAFWHTNPHEVGISLSYSFIIWFLVGVCGINGALFLFYCRQSVQRNMLLTFVATITFLCGYLAIVEPIQLYTNRTRAFVTTVEEQRLRDHARLVFYKEDPDGLPIKYLINVWHEERCAFIDTVQALIQFSVPAYFITNTVSYTSLPQQVAAQFIVIAQGQVGRKDVVVFKKK